MISQMDANCQNRCAVVGGGMLGMTLALRLAQCGQRVTLFEAADHLGGLADAWHVGDVQWDRHYHVTLLSDTLLRKLLDELDLEREMQWGETKTGFFTDGKLYSMSNTWEFLRFPPLRLVDKIRLGLTIFYASRIKNWRRLEKIPVADWLLRLSGRRTYEKIWRPLLRAKLGDNYKKTSAAFIWATIARMYAARRTGMKREMFGYVPGGYSRILQHLGEYLTDQGVDIQLGCAVRGIQRNGGGLDVRLDDGRTENYEHVAVTLPGPTIADICDGLTEDEVRRLRGITYQGILCASLVLSKPLADFYVTNITDDWVPFTGVIEMSALVDRDSFDGRSLIYLPKYLPSDHADFRKSDDEIRSEFLEALEQMYPNFRREDVLAFRVSRVPHVCAVSTLNYSKGVPRIETSVPGLYTVTSAQIVNGTLNVNETVKLAEDAVETLFQPAQKHTGSIALERDADVQADRQLVT